MSQRSCQFEQSGRLAVCGVCGRRVTLPDDLEADQLVMSCGLEPRTRPCEHLQEPTGRRHLVLVGQTRQWDVEHGCELHGSCTRNHSADDTRRCFLCPDYSPAEARLSSRTDCQWLGEETGRQHLLCCGSAFAIPELFCLHPDHERTGRNGHQRPAVCTPARSRDAPVIRSCADCQVYEAAS